MTTPDLGTAPAAIVEEIVDNASKIVEDLGTTLTPPKLPELTEKSKSILKNPLFWIAVAGIGYVIYSEIRKRKPIEAKFTKIEGTNSNAKNESATATEKPLGTTGTIDWTKAKGPNEGARALKHPTAKLGASRAGKSES